MPRVAWKSFTDARAVARGLGLKGWKGWQVWSKSGQRPSDIPSSPDQTYRDDGWISWPDWLGNGKERAGPWKSFTDGRALARGLELKSQKGWKAWSKSGQRPSNIPGNPAETYRDDGWISWPDWLCFEGRAPPGNMLPFAVGRAYVRKLKLKTQKEWKEWNKSGQRPSTIPSNPALTYRDDGWISWPDWLGSERVAWKSFTAGRAYARKLKLRNNKEWREWSKSGQCPSNIPPAPEQVYRDDGWVSWPDWLGSERVAWKSFTDGWALVRGLELKGKKEWLAWSKSEQRPSDIPADPSKAYRDVGWISWNDWLGNGKERVAWKSFTEGRALVRGLGLKGQKKWWAWSKSDHRPSDIPS
jgi:hypothetical protein